VSEQFCDVGGGVTLCYETFGEESDPTALLIMGLGTQMVAWQESFCRQLAACVTGSEGRLARAEM